MKTKLPIRTEKCSIIDALIEIRFETSLFPNAVFGLIYDVLREDYPDKVEKLPILQLPEQLREQDPGLKFKPHYKIENARFIVQIGPDVLTVSSKTPYPGWDVFESQVFYILEKVIKKGIVTKVTRLGHRYINFLLGDILPGLNIEFSVCNSLYSTSETTIRTEIRDGEFINTLQLSNSVTLEKDNELMHGSIIDIDTYRSFKDLSFTDSYEEYIDAYKGNINIAHKTGKRLFFSLLKEDLLDSLNPIYDDGE